MKLKPVAEAYVKYEKNRPPCFVLAGFTRTYRPDDGAKGYGRAESEARCTCQCLHGLRHFSDDVNLRLGQEECLLHQPFHFLEACTVQRVQGLIDVT
jgi:hypothetical protein